MNMMKETTFKKKKNSYTHPNHDGFTPFPVRVKVNRELSIARMQIVPVYLPIKALNRG